ncbi:MAG: hypothetical protein NC213_10140 [Acetobacter sp.]|nr:hypothetical protein [Bacteroides sp.]MCM1342093.1 hypothetical protein [Acetobacter sp.]MCM1434298.1 hypothetical protein [Clostridiales bacterium]
MSIIYDIRNETQPKNILLIIFGGVFIFAFLIVFIRLVLALTGKVNQNKLNIFLDCIGIIFIPILSVILISFNVNSIVNFSKYSDLLENDGCITICGKPENIVTYEVNTHNEDLLEFTIGDEYFDTYNLYGSEKLTKIQIDKIVNSKELTIKYVKEKKILSKDEINWIVYIKDNSDNIGNNSVCSTDYPEKHRKT